MPKKTLAVIVASGNDYCVQVKANQATLLEKLQQTAAQQPPIDQDENRGRLQHRRVKLFEAPLPCRQDYPGLVAFAQLRRWGIATTKPRRPSTITS